MSYLADALQYSNCVLEISDVENGYYELDVRVMPNAIHWG